MPSPGPYSRDTDPMAALRAANPVPPPATAPTTGPDQVFDHLVASASSTEADPGFAPPPSEGSVRARRSPQWGRRLAWGGVAAAVLAVAGLGVSALIPQSLSPAQASVVQAAQATEAATSGTAVITLTAGSGRDNAETHTMVANVAYHQDDLAVVVTAPDAEEGPLELRVVDGVVYFRIGGEEWQGIDDRRITSALATFGLPFADLQYELARGLVDLVRSADDVSEIGPGHYRATVTAAQALELVRRLPMPGLTGTDVLADLPAEAADHTFVVDATLDDAGRLDAVHISPILTESEPELSISLSVELGDLAVGLPIAVPEGAVLLDLATLLEQD